MAQRNRLHPALPVGLVALAITCATVASAQSSDPTALARDLGTPARRAAAIARLIAAPESALPGIWSVGLDLNTPLPVRLDIINTLKKTYATLNAQRQKKNDALAAAWSKATFQDPYARIGIRNTKWDRFCLAALANLKNAQNSYKQFKAAVDAGCTDPYIRFNYIVRSGDQGLLPPNQVAAQLGQIAKEMDASKYPDGRKFYAYLLFLQWAQRGGGISADARRQAVDRAVALYPGLIAENIPLWSLRSATKGLMDVAKEAIPDHKAAFDKVYPVVAKALPDNGLSYHLAASFYIDYASDARGTGLGSTVTAAAKTLFDERIRKARDAALTGAVASPLDEECPVDMIVICMAMGTPRLNMEEWFQRAITCNPGSYDACSKKAYYLSPRWCGSEKEELDFGRECIKASVESRIAAVMLEVISDLAKYSGNVDAYMSKPETWVDIKAAEEKLLSDKNQLTLNRPQCLHDRAAYVQYAYICHQWQAVISLAREFGKDIDLNTLGGQEMLDYYVKDATEHLHDNAP